MSKRISLGILPVALNEAIRQSEYICLCLVKFVSEMGVSRIAQFIIKHLKGERFRQIYLRLIHLLSNRPEPECLERFQILDVLQQFFHWLKSFCFDVFVKV